MKSKVEVTEIKNATLDGFVDAANHNSSDFLKNSDAVHLEVCRGVHRVFTKAIQNFSDPMPPTPIFFFGRAHSAFLGATRVCISYEVPEAYMILRGVLENALYAFWVAEKPEMANIWMKREADKQAVRRNFQIKSIKDLLEEKYPVIGKLVSELYEQTIDYGAHPNVLATTVNTEYSKLEGTHHFQMNYLSGITPGFIACLKTVPTIGLAALDVFSKIYSERFEMLGVIPEIERMKKGL